MRFIKSNIGIRTKNLFRMALLLSFIGFVVGIFLFTPASQVFAAQPYQLLAPIPSGVGGGGELTQVAPGGLGAYVIRIFTAIIGLAGVLAVLMLVVGGIEYISPSVTMKEAGRKRMTHAIGGLLIALAAWLILRTINPNLVDLKIVPNAVNINAKLPTKSSAQQIQEVSSQIQAFQQAEQASKVNSAPIECSSSTCGTQSPLINNACGHSGTGSFASNECIKQLEKSEQAIQAQLSNPNLTEAGRKLKEEELIAVQGLKQRVLDLQDAQAAAQTLQSQNNQQQVQQIPPGTQ
ncbi:MAG: hypothetical protein COW88_02155 [Candidatus Lloydbacteria bacterium CG22_combo_CG10-13_8_21_14_all_47_15]|uniref:Uncharacterized protein n=1 Tax=Candidatus Lloydbacteria bacterium CG22_combo_CG10-13_8_21_14_all_47_15 TaxID=1974635 RepID=A0A2H0CUK4_9BACT|nr:MAG: hypothetical protein COW88_02155 [Candidatus Lloydbacteria bacterium CG22_combo_CG10-13_8_21_14_all_47_15]